MATSLLPRFTADWDGSFGDLCALGGITVTPQVERMIRNPSTYKMFTPDAVRMIRFFNVQPAIRHALRLVRMNGRTPETEAIVKCLIIEKTWNKIAVPITKCIQGVREAEEQLRQANRLAKETTDGLQSEGIKAGYFSLFPRAPLVAWMQAGHMDCFYASVDSGIRLSKKCLNFALRSGNEQLASFIVGKNPDLLRRTYTLQQNAVSMLSWIHKVKLRCMVSGDMKATHIQKLGRPPRTGPTLFVARAKYPAGRGRPELHLPVPHRGSVQPRRAPCPTTARCAAGIPSS